ncbi:MAG: 30S ribosomal protein S16 [Rickettsiales bacterium]|nr:30S ribosomal protein S16 [Rickettsiales bacterium]
MSAVIRLARAGTKKKPFYRIIVADKRAPRDGDFIEKIGTFNPLLAKDSVSRVVFNAERAKHWLAMGALPSDRVNSLFIASGLTKKLDVTGKPQKPRKKADKLTRAEKRAAAEIEAKAAAKAEAEAAKAAPAVEAPAEAAAPAEEAPAV